MSNKNANLIISRIKKDDEFYTRYEDIEEELKHYIPYFEGKVIYCNCDDLNKSNFYKYLNDNFYNFKIKKLITSYYDDINNPIITIKTANSYTARKSKYNGDFRSQECIELLKECDIVITNPPFSLFREFISLLYEYNKKFLIIGSMNALTYNNVFPLIKDNKLWTGYNPVHYFIRPDGTIKSFGNILWYTNLDVSNRHSNIINNDVNYDESIYQKYENYDAININKLTEIPGNYYGVMGVPITYLIKHNPDEFEILGLDKELTSDHNRGIINGKRLYARVFIRRKV